LELAEALLNLHEDIPQNVLRRCRVRHPRADELTQLFGESCQYVRALRSSMRRGFTASMLRRPHSLPPSPETTRR
jgi:hypothetical protein